MSFRSEVRARVGWDWDDGTKDISKLNYEETLLSTDTTTTAEAVWHDESRALLEDASDLFDLSSMVRTVRGDVTHTTSFRRIKAVEVVNLSTTGGKLIIGNSPYDACSGPFSSASDSLEVPLDSEILLVNRVAGWPVTWLGAGSSSSSGDGITDRMLRITASGGAVTYSIAIVGKTTADA